MMDKVKSDYSPAFVYEKEGYYRIIWHWRPNFKVPMKRFRKTFGLNRIHNKKRRKYLAGVFARLVTEMLEEGWNPITGEFPESKRVEFVKTEDLKADISLIDGLRKAHRHILLKSDKKRTHQSYNSHLKLFANYLRKNKLYNISIEAFERMDAIEYQKSLMQSGLANKTINTKTDYVNGLFKWLKKVRLITDNPFDAVDHLKEKESKANNIFTFDELDKIKDYCLENFPELWQYGLFIYFCFMRPASIMHIKRKDIDLSRKLLFIKGENHKNGKDAYKQLLPGHLEYLEPFLKDLQPDHYLFSKGLRPGKFYEYPTRAAELWAKHIKQNLGINKNAYGLKNTGGVHFLELHKGQENLKWLQMQMAHSDLQTTSIYTNKMKVIKLEDDNGWKL